MTLKISISGIRGTPEFLTEEVCKAFARAFATWLGNCGKVAVGCDTRPNSAEIKAYVLSALTQSGINCIDIGIAPTPTVGVYVHEKKLSGGIMITASHNPLPWNGIKFMRADGIFLNETEAGQLIHIYNNKTFKTPTASAVGKITRAKDALDVHIRKILAAVNAEKIKKKKFKIVVDPVNGAGCKLSPKLLKRLGCKVSLLHANPDKTFERPAEPTPKAISALAKKVKAVGADAGFALDPDADRLAIVDEQGHALSEELSVVLATDYLLKSKPPRQYVVANLSTTMALDDIVKKHRGRLVRTKIGEVHVSEKMKQLKAAIGGEGNGGVIFPKVGFNRDSFSGMTLILVYLASSGEKLSTLVNKIPPYHHIKEKITVSSAREAAALIKKTKAVFKGEKVDLTEGIKIIFKDGWLHVRASNTEPIVRVMGEGKDKRKIIDCCHKILGAQT